MGWGEAVARHLTELVHTITPDEWRALRTAIARPYADIPEPQRSTRINHALGELLQDGTLLRLVMLRRAWQARADGA